MKNSKNLFLLSASLLLSCKEYSKNTEEASSISAVTSEKLSENVVEGETQTDFDQYWLNFRKAVMDNDSSKIIQLTKFPFETRGPMDTDPIIKYDRQHFMFVFRAFLNQSISGLNQNDEMVEVSEFIRIKATLQPDTSYVTTDWARVGNLQFQKKKSGGKWELTFAYLEYPTIEQINKDLQHNRN